MAQLPTPALVIIDLLSHQGPHDNLFALTKEALGTGLVDASKLFIFTDLQPYKVALATADRVASAVASSKEDPLALLTALLGGLGSYSRRGRKDFPFLAHMVRGDGPARLSAVLDHALKDHPELCAVEHADAIEPLHNALARFISHVVVPRIAGCATTVVMLSHGGTARLNSRGRLDGPAGVDTCSPT